LKNKNDNGETLLSIVNYLSGLDFKEPIQSYEIILHFDDGSSLCHEAIRR
jgi:hypothetical protein